MDEIARRLAEKLFDQPLIQNQFGSAYVEAMIGPYLESDGWSYVGDGWSGWDFERGAPLTAPGFSRMIERAAAAADLGIKAHAHMLRHACGYKLANDGHDTRSLQAYLGHRNIQNTTRYTALAPDRFKRFWQD
jgi:integrase